MEVSNKEDWLKERTTGIGGSEASIILGINPWKSKLELWNEKVTGITEEKDSMVLRLGKKLEPFIIEEYIEETRRDVEAGTLALENIRSKEHSFMIANLDGRITDKIKGYAVLECKIKSAFVRWDEEIPNYYFSQIQHCLAVTGYSWASFAVLNLATGKLEWKDIERDEEFIKKLIEEESKFWKLVQDEVPPEVENTKSCGEFLKKKYSKSSGKTIDLRNDDTATSWAIRLELVKNQLKSMKEQEIECKNNLMNIMKDAETGIGDGYKITWKAPDDKIEFNVDKFKENYPELYNEFIEPKSQSRRFNVWFKKA